MFPWSPIGLPSAIFRSAGVACGLGGSERYPPYAPLTEELVVDADCRAQGGIVASPELMSKHQPCQYLLSSGNWATELHGRLTWSERRIPSSPGHKSCTGCMRSTCLPASSSPRPSSARSSPADSPSRCPPCDRASVGASFVA